jgi:hypothetical protein
MTSSQLPCSTTSVLRIFFYDTLASLHYHQLTQLQDFAAHLYLRDAGLLAATGSPSTSSRYASSYLFSSSLSGLSLHP